MHIAVPEPGVRRRPAYGTSFGFAAVLLSAIGVDTAHDAVHGGGIADPAFLIEHKQQTRVAADASSVTEWDDWKSVRDVG